MNEILFSKDVYSKCQCEAQLGGIYVTICLLSKFSAMRMFLGLMTFMVFMVFCLLNSKPMKKTKQKGNVYSCCNVQVSVNRN